MHSLLSRSMQDANCAKNAHMSPFPHTTLSASSQLAILVVAAGRGQRMGAALPKQYLPLAGQPVLRHSIQALLAAAPSLPCQTSVHVVIHPEDEALYRHATDGLHLAPPIAGGATRQASVYAGLQALASLPNPPAYVAIHDAARPFPSPALWQRLWQAQQQQPDHGIIPTLLLVDCVKQADASGLIQATLPRAMLRRAQTPQCFPLQAILHAHQQAAGQELPDDAAVFEQAGLPVQCVDGDEANRKLTTPDDLQWAEQLLHPSHASHAPTAAAIPYLTITGHGYDVHQLECNPAKPLMICGVAIPFEQSLKGHSDADVGLHALVDAILGTIAAEDIGFHFSPKDARWKDADSATFLHHALHLLTEQGGRLLHCDITLVGEAPKFGPHRDAMKRKLAELTGLPLPRISIKATTTETLGFTGRREGLAAFATATVQLPADTPGS